MTYLLEQIWVAIALALALGLFMGWATCGEDKGGDGGWLRIASIGFALGALAAILKILPGFWGLALEIGLLLFSAYIIGCAIGCRFFQPDSAASSTSAHSQGGAH